MKPLTQKDVELAENKHRYLQKVEDRCNYIIYKIYEVFGIKLQTWYFPDAEKSELGDFFRASYGESVDIIASPYESCDDLYIIFNGKKYNLKAHFPKRWLFENFEEELILCKKLYEEKFPNKVKKTNKAELIASIKSKLTKEELEMISIK